MGITLPRSPSHGNIINLLKEILAAIFYASSLPRVAIPKMRRVMPKFMYRFITDITPRPCGIYQYDTRRNWASTDPVFHGPAPG